MTRPILDLAQGSLIVVLSIGWWVATRRRAEASARYEDARMITLSGAAQGSRSSLHLSDLGEAQPANSARGLATGK